MILLQRVSQLPLLRRLRGCQPLGLRLGRPPAVTGASVLDEGVTETGDARFGDQPDDEHAREEAGAEQLDNETLIEVHALAHKFARRLCSADTAEDIAQDVVMKCLEQMRLGIWDTGESPLKNLPGLIRHMVKCQRVDRRRAENASAKRDPNYAQDREQSISWSSPDLALEEREATRLFRDVLDSLPWMYRVTYVLVRDRQLTYDEAAEYLEVDVSSVRAYMVRIRHAFRQRLLDRGIVPPPPSAAPPYVEVLAARAKNLFERGVPARRLTLGESMRPGPGLLVT
jgi:RNA polymerase sigma factor (sigma-70 family)